MDELGLALFEETLTVIHLSYRCRTVIFRCSPIHGKSMTNGNLHWLVVSTPLKKHQPVMSIPFTYGKTEIMFQTTNQWKFLYQSSSSISHKVHCSYISHVPFLSWISLTIDISSRDPDPRTSRRLWPTWERCWGTTGGFQQSHGGYGAGWFSSGKNPNLNWMKKN